MKSKLNFQRFKLKMWFVLTQLLEISNHVVLKNFYTKNIRKVTHKKI